MVRVRHYTRVSAMRKIIEEQLIIARDQNKVFVERVAARRLSPVDARAMYKLGRGKGGAYVEFDVEEQLLKSRYNRSIKDDEWYLDGSVNLTNRNAQDFLNR